MRKARLGEIRTAYPLLSINELRAQYFQLPPVPWGDVAVRMEDNPPSQLSETPAAKSEIETELSQWERFALNRLDKPEQARPFAVTALPDELAFEVSGGFDVRRRSRGGEVGVCRGAGWAGGLTTSG